MITKARSIGTVRDLAISGYRTWRKRGALEVFRRSLQLSNINYQGYWYAFNCWWKRLHRDYSYEADPYATVETDPTNISCRWPKEWDKWKHMGDVKSGDWDRPDRRYDETSLYRSLKAHFENKSPWNEVEKVKEAIISIEAGEPAWNNSLTVKEVYERCEHLDVLYEEIKQNGFKSQSEIEGEANEQIIKNGSFDRSKTDIAVHIDRNGEFLFCDGRHRFAIARILELDTVPVRVVVRHEQWQEIREQVGAGRSLNEIDRLDEEMLSHPDLQDLMD